MIGPALERDAVNPYALSYAPQSSAEPLIVKLGAGVLFTLALTAFAWIGAQI